MPKVTIKDKITITAISDTHGAVRLQDLLKGYESDVLIHCGDFTSGEVDRICRDRVLPSHRASWLDFVSQVAAVRDQFKTILVVPGNHDSICEIYPFKCEVELLEAGGLLLTNSAAWITNGNRTIDFWGMPHTPPFYSWFFEGHDMSKYVDKIPATIDVLVSHGPPRSILDRVAADETWSGEEKRDLGSQELYKKCKEMPHLKAVFFGHIHSSHGHERHDGVDYFNCSILGERYERRFDPVVTEINV